MTTEFDTMELRRRAHLWRIEVTRAPAGPLRIYCQNEAERCERRLRQSFETPVISVIGGCSESGVGSAFWRAA
jgi:hypothetical protein